MCFLRILIVGAVLAASHASEQDAFSQFNYSFAAYKAAHARAYAAGSSEHEMREQIFNQRSADIITHNLAQRSWQKGFNQFTDRTEEEMESMRGFKRSVRREAPSFATGTSILEIEGVGKSCSARQMSCVDSERSCCNELVCGSAGVCEKPAAITETKDWSSLATSKTVLDQGSCGSCWAVAAAAAIQFQAAKNYPNFNKVLSPQSILSCTPNKHECGGQGGCKGATPALGFEWVKQQGANGGVLPLSDADQTSPNTEVYTATDEGGTCEGTKKASFLQIGQQKKPANPPSVSVGGWRKVGENKASEVLSSLVTTGPLAVAIVGREIQSYDSGVLDNCNNNFVVDHAVVMMGYGTDPNHGMYWHIRNSWGPDWGDKGFLKLRRHTPKGEEPCGWDNQPEVGVVCKNENGEYPKKTWVCGECGIISDVSYPVDVRVPPALLTPP